MNAWRNQTIAYSSPSEHMMLCRILAVRIPAPTSPDQILLQPHWWPAAPPFSFKNKKRSNGIRLLGILILLFKKPQLRTNDKMNRGTIVSEPSAGTRAKPQTTLMTATARSNRTTRQLELEQELITTRLSELERSDHCCPNFSESSSGPPTPTDTSNESTPRALSPLPMLFIDDHSDHQVPIVVIDPGGDTVLSLRLFDFDQGGHAAPNKTEGKPLARLRVSSEILRKASTVMIPTVTAMLPTKSPLLWTHMDDNQNLSLLIKSKNQLAQPGGRGWALETLMGILHFTRDPAERFASLGDCAKDEAVMIAFVADTAWALGCVGPVVPWIYLWLTHVELRSAASGSLDWWWPCLGIVVGFVVGDATAFERWSKVCIRYGCDSAGSPFDQGLYVCDVVYGKLYIPSATEVDCMILLLLVFGQPPFLTRSIGLGLGDIKKRRQQHAEEFETVLDQTFAEYGAVQTTPSRTFAYCAAIGAFARAAYDRHLRQFPFKISDERSLGDWMLDFLAIKECVSTQWEAFSVSDGGFPGYPDIENPAHVFGRRVETLWAGVGGLNLGDYRQVPHLPALDVDTVVLRSSKWDWVDPWVPV